MHILQPKHTKLSQEEIKKLTSELNISLSQLPKIKIIDTALPEGCEIGDLIKIERAIEGKKTFYYRVVSV
jgi:DNA-directed RNA polymerase subunit H (RpoH/RPB5)